MSKVSRGHISGSPFFEGALPLRDYFSHFSIFS